MKAISSIAALAMAFACVAAHELRGGSAVKLHSHSIAEASLCLDTKQTLS